MEKHAKQKKINKKQKQKPFFDISFLFFIFLIYVSIKYTHKQLIHKK